jgi:hypothetical protein
VLSIISSAIRPFSATSTVAPALRLEQILCPCLLCYRKQLVAFSCALRRDKLDGSESWPSSGNSKRCHPPLGTPFRSKNVGRKIVSESKVLKFFAPHFSTDAFSTFRSYWGETGERLFPHTPEVNSIPYEILASKLRCTTNSALTYCVSTTTNGSQQLFCTTNHTFRKFVFLKRIFLIFDR